MKKTAIFIGAAILTGVFIGAAALAREWRADNTGQKDAVWAFQAAERPEADSFQREARNFDDGETAYNPTPSCCGPITGGRNYGKTPRSGYSCH